MYIFRSAPTLGRERVSPGVSAAVSVESCRLVGSDDAVHCVDRFMNRLDARYCTWPVILQYTKNVIRQQSSLGTTSM